MNLYTEEQVIQMIEKSRETGLTAEYLILITAPIELPSNEDIDDEFAIGWSDYQNGQNNGAKFMRDLIQGGNK